MTTLRNRPVSRYEERMQDRRLRGLTTAVVFLVAALIGLGIWAIYDYVGERDSAVTGDVQTLLDDYTAAWNDHDGAAFLDLVTSDYTFDNGFTVTNAENQSRAIETSTDFVVEELGEPIMVGDGPWIVAQANHTTYGSSDLDGMSLITVVEEGGMLKIASHIWNQN